MSDPYADDAAELIKADPVFAKAVALVLKHEGGLVDDVSDPGGLTNFGIALTRHPELTADDIRAMTEARATVIYHDQYWQQERWCELPAIIAVKAFDLSIPDGASSAIRALQRACWAAGKRVHEDGVLGIATIGAAGFVSTAALLAALKSELAAHFRLVAAARPATGKFLEGWLARAYE